VDTQDFGSKTASPGQCIPCLFLSYVSARFIIVYLHSNAEDLGRCYPFCASVRAQFQVHVLAVEYPGYGICPGGPCDELKVTDNALVAMKFILEVMNWPLDSIIVMGRSIGCGPAISLAMKYKISGLVTVSPMLSVKDISQDMVGPLAHLIDERFPNKDRIPHILAPLLVVHGQKDRIIPYRHGVQLYKACRSRKLLVCPPDMEHNSNLLSDVTYLTLPMLQFFPLPDYCFDDVSIPEWVFNKELSPFYRNLQIKPLKERKESDDCDTPQQPNYGCLRCPAIVCPAQRLDEGMSATLKRLLFCDKPSSSTPVAPPVGSSVAALVPPLPLARTQAKVNTSGVLQASPKPAPQPSPQPDLSVNHRVVKASSEVQSRSASRNLLQGITGGTPRDVQAPKGGSPRTFPASRVWREGSTASSESTAHGFLGTPQALGFLTRADCVDIVKNLETHISPDKNKEIQARMNS